MFKIYEIIIKDFAEHADFLSLRANLRYRRNLLTIIFRVEHLHCQRQSNIASAI